MPGRSGYLSGGGWLVSGGSSLPGTLTVNSRAGNDPAEYKALELIQFEDGFGSGSGDDFTAYIASGEGGGSDGSSLEGNSGYRYGFNGKENDNDVKGEGNQQDYGMRIYDGRLGRFLSVDPLTKGFSMLTPYQYASNSPVINIDLDGLEGVKVTDVDKKTITVVTTVLYVLKTTEEQASGTVTQKQLDRIKTKLEKELTKKEFKDETTGFDVKFQVNYTPMASMADAYKAMTDNDNIQDDRMLLEMGDEKNLGIIKDEEGNEYQVTSPGESTWRIYKLTSSRNGHTMAHEIFHNFTHNHKNAPADIKNQIDPKNQREGHKKASGIFVWADDRPGGATIEDINQKNIQDVLRTVPEKEKPKPVAPVPTPAATPPPKE